jgi:hypothetical protein
MIGNPVVFGVKGYSASTNDILDVNMILNAVTVSRLLRHLKTVANVQAAVARKLLAQLPTLPDYHAMPEDTVWYGYTDSFILLN